MGINIFRHNPVERQSYFYDRGALTPFFKILDMVQVTKFRNLDRINKSFTKYSFHSYSVEMACNRYIIRIVYVLMCSNLIFYIATSLKSSFSHFLKGVKIYIYRVFEQEN